MPKADKFGNYRNYYGYRNPPITSDHLPGCACCRRKLCDLAKIPAYQVEDLRLPLFDPEWFTGKRVLDIGCNAGLLTIAIGKNFSPEHVLGIDIDSELIRKANYALRLAYSRTKPSQTPTHHNDALFPSYLPFNYNLHSVQASNHSHIDFNYFPVSMPLLFSPLPIPLKPPHSFSPPVDSFPFNTSFQVTNIVHPPTSFPPHLFDTILILSVTKWIHLQTHDDGLRSFFNRIFGILEKGGRIVVECQPWEGYKNYRPTEKEKEIGDMKIRPVRFGPSFGGSLPDTDMQVDESDEGIVSLWSVLEEIGFRNGKEIKGQGDGNTFKTRPIWMFEK